MAVFFVNEEVNVEDGVIKTPLFTLYDEHIVINHKQVMRVFNWNEITNVRFSKKRDLSINILFLFLTVFFYFFSDYCNLNVLCKFLLFVIAVVLSAISLAIRKHTYKLVIDVNHFVFDELRLAKKDEPYAKFIVSLFSNNYNKK